MSIVSTKINIFNTNRNFGTKPTVLSQSGYSRGFQISGIGKFKKQKWDGDRVFSSPKKPLRRSNESTKNAFNPHSSDEIKNRG